MRKLEIGQHRFTSVLVDDEPGEGGACHEYRISRSDTTDGPKDDDAGEFGHIRFQNGPVAQVGVNGCHHEDLLAIVIDRLRHFQAGPLACRENALALTKIEEAMAWLNHRTNDRQQRGVEGTNKARHNGLVPL